jgi:hypothetical protein
MEEKMAENNHDEKDQEKTPKHREKELWRRISEYLQGGSLLEIYMKALSLVTDNEIMNFKIKQIRVQTGMDLIPLYDNNLKEETKKELKTIYKKANETLKNSYPKSRQTRVTFSDSGQKKIEIYKIFSDEKESGEYQSKFEHIDLMQDDYRRGQFESCSQKLEEVDNEIRKILTKYDVLSKYNVESEIDKMLSIMINEMRKEILKKKLVSKKGV